jgi:hypothetical protein
MSSSNRPALVRGLVGSLLAFLALSATGTLPTLRKTRQEYLGFLDQCEREWQRAGILEQQFETLHRRLEGKRAVVRELWAGRITLAEAACQFRSLEAAYPLGSEGPSGTYRMADSEGERLCQRVLSWVGKPPFLDRAGSAEAGRMRELYEEMEALRGPDGLISLPQ